jgi:hypothetical protein
MRAGAPLVLGLALFQSSGAVEPRVAGLDDLVIYDPGVHERGLPGVEFLPDGDGLVVEIPPIVHVHRYYYSGNKEFQGPIIAGGPTVERMYIDTMLPAGAPIVEYDDSSITYAFPDRRVIIVFSCRGKDQATVKYYSGKGLVRKLKEQRDKAKEEHKAAVARSAFANAVKGAAGDVKKVCVGTVGVAGAAATSVVETGTKIVRAVPGVQMLQSAADQRAERLELEGLKQAGERQAAAETELIRTVR